MLNDIPTVKEVVATTAPPVFVTSTHLMGLPWAQWAIILTCIYTAFQIVRLLPKMYSCALCFSRSWKCKKECKQ